ncbi:MAG: hypothetical protein RL625_1694 [Gemmatimonadota bacterium]
MEQDPRAPEVGRGVIRPAEASSGQPTWIGAEGLPDSLRDLSNPPAGLWCVGDPGLLADSPDRLIAIVGTREPTTYGLRMATRLAAASARAGLVVVSGMARGVDVAAHRAALEAGGRTIGVQGTGVDVPYPVAHRTLLAEMGRRALVISEVEPGTRAFQGCFPRRNRIIAALCRVTLVVEAGFKSGAVNTATQALELGRVVAGVPGRIDDPTAAGVNLLIRDGAQVITDVEDMLGLYGLSTNAKAADWRDGWGGAGGEEVIEGAQSGSESSVRTVAWQALQRELSGQ